MSALRQLRRLAPTLARLSRPVSCQSHRFACLASVTHLPTLTHSSSLHTTRSFSAAPATATAASALSPSEVEQRVLDVVKKFPKIEPTKVTPTATFASDLGLDSLDAVELVMALEDEFEVEISDGEADKIQSVADAIGFIKQHPKAH